VTTPDTNAPAMSPAEVLEVAVERFYEDPSDEARVDVAFAMFELGFPENCVAGALTTMGVKLAIWGQEMTADAILDLLADWLSMQQ